MITRLLARRSKKTILFALGLFFTVAIVDLWRSKYTVILHSHKRNSIERNVHFAMKYLALSSRYERDKQHQAALMKLGQTLSVVPKRKHRHSNIFDELTLLVDCVHEAVRFSDIISELSKYTNKPVLQKMKIIVSVLSSTYSKHRKDAELLTKHFPNLRIVTIKQHITKSAIKTVNYLVGFVNTKYVFFARSYNLFNVSAEQINKIISPLSTQRAQVVGGTVMAHRRRGWNLGCYQSSLLWYQFKMQHGYDVLQKRTGYMQCDVLEGPFATPTSLLLEHLNSGTVVDQFTEETNLASHYVSKYDGIEISISLVYADYFHFLKESSQRIEICVECIFLGIIESQKADPYLRLYRSDWQSYGTKNGISEVLVQPGLADDSLKHHIFSCIEVNIKCHLKKKDMFAEKCCMRNLHNSLIDSYRIFDKYGLQYASSDGTMLGSAKMMATLPWDLDHDFVFRTNNFTEMMKHEHEFLQSDIVLKTEFEDTCMTHPVAPRFTCGYVGLKSKGWRLEAWGQYLFANDYHEAHKIPSRNKGLFEPGRIQGVPTYSQMGDYWSLSQPNPGLGARGGYGQDALKHAKHWILAGMKHSSERYSTTSGFGKCSRECFHGCMNRFLSDGNIQFHRPWA